MPGWIFAGFWDFVHDGFMDVVTVHLHFLTLFFAPFGCGGLCAAHGIFERFGRIFAIFFNSMCCAQTAAPEGKKEQRW